MTTRPHPTAARCKRCGAAIPTPWIPHPFVAGEMIADRWCSEHCYGVEPQEQSQRLCRAQRMRATPAERGEEREAA